jgi:hypothetical protein
VARRRGEHQELEERIADFRGRMNPLGREWAVAYEKCSIPGLAEAAGRIVEWLQDRCVRQALSPAELVRVDAFISRTPEEVEALAARREALRASLKAKIVIAEGYLHTAEEAARTGHDSTHDRLQVERVVAEAFGEVVAAIRVPHICVDDLMERLSGLRPRLETVLATLPPMDDPSDCSKWPGTTARPHPATGRIQCQCDAGQAWSKVYSRCLPLAAGSAAGGGAPLAIDCSAYPGTLARREPSGEWRCRCPVGEWDDALGRCITPTERLPDPTADGTGVGGSESGFCELAYNLIRYALARGDRAAAESQASMARAAGCSGVDAAIGPSGTGGGTVDHGEGRVSSRNVQICVIDRNSVLDDHFDLFVNGAMTGAVRNPEGGQTCFPGFLRGGSNLIELKLVREMGKSTALVISLNGGEYEGSFSGSHDHRWTISAP